MEWDSRLNVIWLVNSIQLANGIIYLSLGMAECNNVYEGYYSQFTDFYKYDMQPFQRFSIIAELSTASFLASRLAVRN